MECELHNLVQGDMPAHDYCFCLQQLANSLGDCDVPVSDQALVHQSIWGLNLKFNVLKTLLPLLPLFPTFIESYDLVLSDESSRTTDVKHSNETTLLTAGAAASKTEAPVPTQPHADRSTTNANYNNYTNFNNGGHGCGHGRGGGCGCGGRNSGRGGSRHNNNGGHAPQWPNSTPWSSPWGPDWHAPWTGATGPCVLGTRPPLMPGILGLPANDDVSAYPGPFLGHVWSCASIAGCLSSIGLQSRVLVHGYWRFITYDLGSR
jgi:hypothetical protein